MMFRELCVFVVLAFMSSLFAETIWVEGEAASSSTMKGHGWYDSVKKDALSGGGWLSNFHKGAIPKAAYQISVKEGGNYRFWVRANPVAGAQLSWRIDGGVWHKIDWKKDTRDQINIAKDNKPDMRFIAWANLGSVALKSGTHKLEFMMDSKNNNHGAIDCFLFSNEPFVPSGIQKPSNKPVIATADSWFSVIADDDRFSSKSIIDMSKLIPAPAGKFGVLKRNGSILQFESNAKAQKFWAVGASPKIGGRMRTAEEMELQAKWLRKHGVNLVRIHTVIGAVGLLDKAGMFDPVKLDAYDRWFATLKKHGIYTCWSIVYPHHSAILRKNDSYNAAKFAELDALDKHRNGASGQAIVINDFINLDTELQDIVWRYFDKLLNHKNKYTGKAYKDDPALAVVEVQNESNVFFHTLGVLRGKGAKSTPLLSAMVRKHFFQFIKKKYGSKAAVAKAWGNKWDRDDKWDVGELGLQGAYHWGTEGPMYEYKGQHRRTGDYIQFLNSVQKDYYSRQIKRIKATGYKALVVTTAWKGVGSSDLANLDADNLGDMIDRHNYYGGGDGGHRIVEGSVRNKSHLSQPGRGLFSIAFQQVYNKPFCVTEWSMLPPSPYKFEAAPIMAFYGLGLQGWDASYHFSCGAHRFGNGWDGLGKYVSQTPHYMGQFPALAFALYNGHIKEGELVAGRSVNHATIYSAKDSLGQSIGGGEHDIKDVGNKLITAPETFAVGRIGIAFDGSKAVKRDISSYWDKSRKLIKSTTGQLHWYYGERRIEVRTAQTQAIIGAPGTNTVKLPSVITKIKTPYVSVIFTPLDNLALKDSRHILITAMARDMQQGAEYNADWSKLKKLGSAPLLMEPVQARIKFAGPRIKSIRPLDIYGVPRNKTVRVDKDGSFSIDGRYQSYYYEIKR